MTEATIDQTTPSAEPADTADSPPRLFPQRSFACVLALAVLADWLFYGHAVGLSAALFLLALALAAAYANKIEANILRIFGAATVLILAVVPIVIEPGPLAILLGAVAAAYFTVTIAGQTGAAWRDRIVNAIVLLLDGWWRAISDLQLLYRQRPEGMSRMTGAIAWTTWIVPIALGLVFVLLFASANPLIEGWLAALDLKALFAHLSLSRMLFWAMIVSAVWPFVFVRVRSKLRSAVEAEFREPTPDAFFPPVPAELFGKAAILRSLILFNVLFAMQTALDVAYLWGGVALPDGMSYASYAHRGAYPLIVTALLAAAFVIVATRPSSDAGRSKLVRNLVFLFTAQNVMLVVSSILRLDLYIEVYSLTCWRIAAFIWMGLVAVGLVLIVARMALRRSNGWLIAMNLGALVLTLYLIGFISFPKLIADYNVAHSREVSGQGVKLDSQYLLSLGPQAIPAIDRLMSQSKSQIHVPCYIGNQPVPAAMSCIQVRRSQIAVIHEAKMLDWRAWSYRDWRLARYLKTTREAETKSSNAEAAAVRRGWIQN